MPEKIREVAPPRYFGRWLARFPIWLYRVRLGWVLGKRFLMITHIGRKSGLPRKTVLEVVSHNTMTNTYYIAAGFGERADWFLNLTKTPQVRVQVGLQQWEARAERLPPEKAAYLLLNYARRHPLVMYELTRVMGYRVDGTDEDYLALGRIIPIMALMALQTTANNERNIT